MGRAVKALRGVMEYDPQKWFPYGMDLQVHEIHLRLWDLPVGAKLVLETRWEANEGTFIASQKKTRMFQVAKGATSYRETFFLQNCGEITIEIYLPKDAQGKPTHRCEYWLDPQKKRPVRRSQQKLSFLVPEGPGIGQVPENRVKPWKKDEEYDQLPGTLFALQPEEEQ